MGFAKDPSIPSSSWRSSVYVAHGSGPYANSRRALESVGPLPVRGKRVLLKPNVGRVAQPGSGIVTHPEVVAAAIDFFREAGADVAIGESPIVGINVHEAFAAVGALSHVPKDPQREVEHGRHDVDGGFLGRFGGCGGGGEPAHRDRRPSG